MAAVIMAGSLRIDPERALAMPCIVINSRDPDLSLSAAASIVVASSLGHDEGQQDQQASIDVAEVFPESDKQNEVVLLPWAIGDESGSHSHSHSVSSNTLVRRITVEVRYSGRHGGALLVVVPQSMAEAVQQVQASAVDFGADLAMTTASSTAASAPGTLHYARCAGVVEVCKQAARRWTVDMRRRIIVIHMVCRMPLNAQISLSKVVEDNMSSTLFVLTSEAPASIDSRLSSRALLCRVPVRSVPKPPPEPSTSTSSNPMRRTVGAWVNAISSGRSGILDCYETLVGGWTTGAPHLPESPECPPHVPGDVVQALAEADHTLALIRKRGGDLACMRVAVAAVMRHRLREVLSVRPF